MKSKIALITLALLASATASAHGVTAGVTGNSALASNSSTSAMASGTGGTTASSYNQGQSMTFTKIGGTVSASDSVTNTSNSLFGSNTRTSTDNKAGDVATEGYTITRNISGAFTTQSGAALGNANALGSATANVGGTGQFHTVTNGPAGNVSGTSMASTLTDANSTGDGGALNNAGMTSEFANSASADLSSSKIQTGSNFFGAFIVKNTTQASDVKNAATSTVSNAGSNGGFTNASGAIGNVLYGTATGGINNNASASSLANASVKGTISTSLNAGL